MTRFSWSRAPVLTIALFGSACGSTSVESVTGPTVDKCPVAVVAPDSPLDAGGGAGTVAISTQPECAWTATSDTAWITDVAPAQGQGNGRVEFHAARNPNGTTRDGAIIINGQRAIIRQRAAQCVVVARVSESQFAAGGGAGTISITTPAGCAWAVDISGGWIAVSPASGAGPATLNVTVAPNAGGPRSGTVAVGGASIAVNQAGAAAPAPSAPAPAPQPSPTCTVTLQPTSVSTPAVGGTGVVSITVATGCGWTASSGVPWISFSTAHTGSGSGSVGFSVAVNTSAASRVGTITVAGATFTVNQAGACLYSITPSSQNFDKDGGTASVAVMAPGGCAWTATSSAGFISITSGASGTGNGTVTYTVARYNGNGTRTGTITIGGQTFAVTQKK